MITIPLTQGKVALVDDEDSHLAKLKWYAARTRGRRWYAMRYRSKVERGNGKVEHVYLHREVIQAMTGMQIDHINGDGLDCRRSNLRIATNTQNQRNRGKQKNNKSGFKGVHWLVLGKRWQGHIRVNKKKIHLGYFNTAEEAARAYDVAALRHHGDFARPNFICGDIP